MSRARSLWALAASMLMILNAVAQDTPRSFASGSAPAARASESRVIYVVRRGWHIDVGFAAAELTMPLKLLAEKFPGARYIFFGFGDRRYLMTKHPHGPAMLEALWPGASLILATGLVASPAEAFGGAHVVTLRLSADHSSAAQNFIWRSLTSPTSAAAGTDATHVTDPTMTTNATQSTGATDATEAQSQAEAPEAPDIFAQGPYEGSLYFRARARYSALHTCNTWAAEVLRAASFPMHTNGVVFAGQVWSQTRKIAATE